MPGACATLHARAMTLRLLHLADLHLDTVVGGRSEAIRGRVRAALLAAFERAIERALELEVHAVLVAGDAFDDALLTGATADVFRSGLRRLAARGVDVAWCTGNHDPGATTLRGRQGRAALLGLDDPGRHGLPRIHVFRGHTPATVTLRDRRGDPVGTLTSLGHESDADGENLARRLARPAGPLPAVAMLHTQVDGAAGDAEHARYAPCTPQDLAAAGFDYWALGHVHVRGPVRGAPAWYAGNPQGRNSKETGARGGLVVELAAGEPPRVAPVTLGALRFESLALRAQGAVEPLQKLGAELSAALGARRREDRDLDLAATVLRVELRGQMGAGRSPLAAALARPEAREEAERALGLELGLLDCELRTAGLAAPLDLADFRATPSALREAHRLLESALMDDALLASLGDQELSPEAPQQGDGARLGYLRDRASGLAGELVARAAREDGGP